MFYNVLHEKKLFTVLMILTGLFILFSWGGNSITLAQGPPTVPATLERTTDTSVYSSPSSDPAGVTLLPTTGQLLISDSEVNEPPLSRTVNLFGTTLSGSLVYTASTLSFSDEPTGVAFNPSNGHLFISDDTGTRGVYELKPGPDGLLHTADDIVSFTNCSAWGCADPEDVAYDSLRGHLLIIDELGEEVFDIGPGPDGSFGGGDDQVTQFDTSGLGLRAPEGIEFNPDNNHLYILSGRDRRIGETTIDGTLLRYINVASLGSGKLAGLAYAPSSTNPSRKHLYIVDRGVDNNTNPDPLVYNDGKLYEISFPGLAEFSAATYSVNEGAGTATITVVVTAPTFDTAFTVNYSTSDGTATAPGDYTATSGSLTFEPGQTSKTFTIPILDDGSDELNETVNLMLDSPSYATLTIEDNDPPPTVEFSTTSFSVNEGGSTATITAILNVPSGRTVTVNYATSNGTATAGSDYTAQSGTLTFDPGQTSRTFTIPILEDALDEDNETVNLTLSNPSNATLGNPNATLTIEDNDPLPTVQFSASNFSVAETGSTATITVFLSPVSARTVTVNYATSNGTATAGSDYTAQSGTLTFNPGQTIRTFTIPILDDSLDESNETVILTLSAPSNATIGNPNATLTIIDDDGLPSVYFDSPTYNVDESAGSATITVILNAPSGQAVTVNYATSDGTATAGSDYTAQSGTLTFNPGQTSRSFSVPIVNDSDNEPNETVVLTLSAPSNAMLDSPSSATLTIIDDDKFYNYLPLIIRR